MLGRYRTPIKRNIASTSTRVMAQIDIYLLYFETAQLYGAAQLLDWRSRRRRRRRRPTWLGPESLARHHSLAGGGSVRVWEWSRPTSTERWIPATTIITTDRGERDDESCGSMHAAIAAQTSHRGAARSRFVTRRHAMQQWKTTTILFITIQRHPSGLSTEPAPLV